jgi:tetratricopeptide (TPR) repeat protein
VNIPNESTHDKQLLVVDVFENEEVQIHPFLDMLLHPFRTMQGIFEYISAWFFTRKITALLPAIPVLIVIPSIFGLAFYGWLQDRETTSQRYAQLVDEEFKRSDKLAAKDAKSEQDPIFRHDEDLAPKQISPYAEMLMRRLIQNDSTDQRWRYLIATQFGQRKRLGQARQMMRKMAPLGTRGFSPAHAWLAVDTISRNGVRDRADLLELINDLEVAQSWSGTGPALHSLLAELLEKEGRVAEAIKVLESYSANEPNLLIQLVGIAQRQGRGQLADETAAQATKLLLSRMAEPRSADVDHINYVRLCLMMKSYDQAARQSIDSMKRFPESMAFPRLLSEAYRLKYLTTVNTAGNGIQCDMDLLDAALKADPTNPSVTEEVAKLLALGSSASANLTQALARQLDEGKATTMTHLLLANGALRESKLEEAIPHLEVAARQAPNSPIVLNNLAVALARHSKVNYQRARQLIDRAVAIAGPDPELLDSQGEIRLLSEDYVGAVQSLEAAIGVDGKRIKTREKLMVAYDKAGLKDMVTAQRKQIEKLKNAVPGNK